MKPAIVNLSLLLATAVAGRADLPQLWQDRTRCVVAVEYTVAAPIGARTVTAYGVVIDEEGDAVLPAGAVEPRIPVVQLTHFRAYEPGEPGSYPAEFLGTEPVNGFAFVRLPPSLAKRRAPLTGWGRAEAVQVGDELWGIGLRSRDEDFTPYLLRGYVALRSALPAPTATAPAPVAGPGLPVFDAAGRWAGLALGSFGQSFLQYAPGSREGSPVLLVNLEESSAVLLAEAAEQGWRRLPGSREGRPIAWSGAWPVHSPAESDGVVVDGVAAGSPAERAGLKSGDLILTLDGDSLTARRPAVRRAAYWDRQIRRHLPGDVVRLGCRDLGGTRRSVLLSLADAPLLPREAERRYISELGLEVRAPVPGDAAGGAGIASAVAPDGPAAAAGVQAGDLFDSADGASSGGFADLAGRLVAAARDPRRHDLVLGDRGPGGEQLLHVHWNR